MRKRKIGAIVILRKRKKEKKKGEKKIMFNKLEFKAAVVENGKTMADVAKYLNINEATLSRKVNGITEFSREEIQKICEFLKLDSPVDIFFAKELT